jgi:homoserine O-acetyltransferase
MTLLTLKQPVSETIAEPAPSAFEVTLPAQLARFGASARASLVGPEGAPVIVLLGGISADCFPCAWWPGLAGPGGAADPGRYRILGLDFIADPAGEAAPSPLDQAIALCAILDAVGVGKAHAVIGASYGGMIALALGQHFPDRVERLVVISADASPHPAATAIRELQRRIVALGLASGNADEALSIARGLAMLSYRTREEFAERFEGGIGGEATSGRSDPGAYLRSRGEAFVAKMTPQRFLSLSASIDRHRVDPARIRVPALLIGADSDQLVPPVQMETLAAALAGPVQLHLLPSLYGHDMFLKDADKVSALVETFL